MKFSFGYSMSYLLGSGFICAKNWKICAKNGKYAYIIFNIAIRYHWLHGYRLKGFEKLRPFSTFMLSFE